MAILSKASNNIDREEKSFSTIIGEGFIINGNLIGAGYTRIDGTIEGDVAIDEGIVLGESGVINGDVRTHEIIVHGVVNGDVNTQEIIVHGRVNGHLRAKNLEIKKSGKIKGSIFTQKVKIEPGGKYNGLLSMEVEDDNLNLDE